MNDPKQIAAGIVGAADLRCALEVDAEKQCAVRAAVSAVRGADPIHKVAANLQCHVCAIREMRNNDGLFRCERPRRDAECGVTTCSIRHGLDGGRAYNDPLTKGIKGAATCAKARDIHGKILIGRVWLGEIDSLHIRIKKFACLIGLDVQVLDCSGACENRDIFCPHCEERTGRQKAEYSFDCLCVHFDLWVGDDASLNAKKHRGVAPAVKAIGAGSPKIKICAARKSNGCGVCAFTQNHCLSGWICRGFNLDGCPRGESPLKILLWVQVNHSRPSDVSIQPERELGHIALPSEVELSIIRNQRACEKDVSGMARWNRERFICEVRVIDVRRIAVTRRHGDYFRSGKLARPYQCNCSEESSEYAPWCFHEARSVRRSNGECQAALRRSLSINGNPTKKAYD